jgi:alkylation response protein AidB-like acyl-CoA dehydrogenase
MISMMKRNNCGNALQHSRVLLDIFGGNACADEYGVGRHEANLQICNTYEGTYVSGGDWWRLTSGRSHVDSRQGNDRN